MGVYKTLNHRGVSLQSGLLCNPVSALLYRTAQAVYVVCPCTCGHQNHPNSGLSVRQEEDYETLHNRGVYWVSVHVSSRACASYVHVFHLHNDNVYI
jgi:hypothetical protein